MGEPQQIGTFLWQAMPEGPEKYQAYLCSREWAERKRTVLARADGQCERCHCNPPDAVHHLTYARKYHELANDLVAHCQGCHDFMHGKSNYDPARKVPANDLRSILSMSHSDAPDGWALIRCPVCDFEFSHVREVFCRAGTDEGQPYQGAVVKGKALGWRRPSLVIVFDGECGHAWRLEIQQHKGNNYIQVEECGSSQLWEAIQENETQADDDPG